jgi:hypothetical protein
VAFKNYEIFKYEIKCTAFAFNFFLGTKDPFFTNG